MKLPGTGPDRAHPQGRRTGAGALFCLAMQSAQRGGKKRPQPVARQGPVAFRPSSSRSPLAFVPWRMGTIPCAVFAPCRAQDQRHGLRQTLRSASRFFAKVERDNESVLPRRHRQRFNGLGPEEIRRLTRRGRTHRPIASACRQSVRCQPVPGKASRYWWC